MLGYQRCFCLPPQAQATAVHGPVTRPAVILFRPDLSLPHPSGRLRLGSYQQGLHSTVIVQGRPSASDPYLREQDCGRHRGWAGWLAALLSLYRREAV